MIACSRMYNVVPEVRAAWQTIFEWVASRADVPLEVIDHAAPAPLDDLWARDDMGCVFMCGWPWAMANPHPEILATPVPSPTRYGGQAVYFTDLVVREDSGFRKLSDTFGGRLAWTIESSHSGYNALRHHLLRYRTRERPRLYAETVGPLVSPIRALQSVVDGAADVAPLDSMCLDILRRHAPGRVAGLRVIETTEAAPAPPLVASPGADADACARMSRALQSAHEDPALGPALDHAMVDRFVTVSPDSYDITRAWADEASEAGYAVLG
jgi:ABC-type phosphate/phosphonate transport system substrate-binding protein